VANHCSKNGAISSGSTSENACLVGICSPGMGDQSSLDASSLCSAPWRQCLPGRTIWRLGGSSSSTPWGGVVWATVFGSGGYLLGAGIHRIAGPVGWAMLVVAVLAAALVWRYFKHHEERLLAAAELEKARYDRR
jgi:hypothetical protein